MQIVIEIPEDVYKTIIADKYAIYDKMFYSIKNGTPLDKHDEEVIKETVESIWGKPPYTELLDKIRAEIEQTAKDYDKFDDYRRVRGLWIALEIIDKYREEKE